MSDTTALSCRESKPRYSVFRRKGSKFPLAMGRWVKTYHPWEGVRLRPIRPIYGFLASDDNSMGVMASVLSEVTNGVKLNHLHILIAPGNQTLPRKLHCFDKKKRSYLGATTVTEPEVEVLKKYENLFKFELSFTDRYFTTKMLATDPETVASLLDRTSDGLFQSSLTFCTPKPVPIKLCNIGVQVNLSIPHIRALGKPKIPVRLRPLEEIRRKKSIEPKPVLFCPNYYCGF